MEDKHIGILEYYLSCLQFSLYPASIFMQKQVHLEQF